jgi:DNA-3-methyladenine glycosylase II
LDNGALRDGVARLVAVDRRLAAIVRRHGPPPLWSRRPGFATLVLIILEQQVSIVSARAVYGRIEAALDGVTTATVLGAGVDGLRALGSTRQKARYCVELASRIEAGEIDLGRVSRSGDDNARSMLLTANGIGPWSADVYLLMALRRPDIWPAGDIALQTAIQCLLGLAARPSADEGLEIAGRWAPWRSVAARILWHGYLSGSLRRQ